MISLISEMTDSKGRRASRGWVFFDRRCRTCTLFAQRFRAALAKRGFELGALDDPRVVAVLGLPPEQLLREMRVVTTDDKRYGGAEAVIYLARQIWWAWPVYIAAQLPGMPYVLGAGYRWFAGHRNCSSGVCLQGQKGEPGDLARYPKEGSK